MEKNKWINIKDSLPEFQKEVLVYWSECGGGVSVGFLREIVGHMTKDENIKFYNWSVYSKIGEKELEVTHWMELPKKPKNYGD